MMKATLRGAVLLGLLALSVPAFAEVQNVKVGGDITVRSFHRENLDLNSSTGGATPLDETDNFLMSTVGLNIGADLTENVGAFIRLANERDWNVDSNVTGDFDLSQAYITLKELFYAPLTLKIGQQPIVWGRGFVLGSNLLPATVLGGGDRNGAITAGEFTDFTAFDAIRATLDLAQVGNLGIPLTLDYVYIKQDENNTGDPDDATLNGVNLSAKLNDMNSEVEAYFLNLRDKNLALCSGQTLATQLNGRQINCKNGSVNTLGFRGSASPVKGSAVWAELAYQFGKRAVDLEAQLASGDSQQAWAANLGTTLAFEDVKMTPSVGAEWRFYSGKDVDGAVTGWRAIAPGYFTTALREFQTRSTITGFYPNSQRGVTSAATNQHEIALTGSLNPLEDLKVNERLSWFFLPVGARPPTSGSNSDRRSYIGSEWDTVVNYNYTDDVQLGLIYGVFFPGNVFRTQTVDLTNNDSVAQELITSVSVKF